MLETRCWVPFFWEVHPAVGHQAIQFRRISSYSYSDWPVEAERPTREPEAEGVSLSGNQRQLVHDVLTEHRASNYDSTALCVAALMPWRHTQ
jgi:hypothetical protein